MINTIFEEMQDIEEELRALLVEFQSIISEGEKSKQTNQISKEISEYSKKLNQALEEYAAITGFENKIRPKSILKYSEVFLEEIIKLIRIVDLFSETEAEKVQELEEEPKPFDMITQITTFIDQKELHLENTYEPLARRELMVFSDTNFRDALEKTLAAKIGGGEEPKPIKIDINAEETQEEPRDKEETSDVH